MSISIQNSVASSEATSFLGQIKANPVPFLALLFLGIFFGIFLGFIYSRAKEKFSSTKAAEKLRSIVDNYEQEKDTSETILKELQVGILAYGGDGRLVVGNPSAYAILETEDVPKTFQGFLTMYGGDNGIQAAHVLRMENISGTYLIQDKTIRIRLTQAQLASYHKNSWIIILSDISEQEREEKQRKEFVANVSHELKTPLTTISAYSETLLDWGLEGKSIQDVRLDIMRIHDDAKRMDTLVQNLLLLSSIDSRGIRPKMTQYDIVSVMKQVVSRMQIQATEKEIQLESSVLSIIPPVFGDANALDRILTNLVSNGIKYTDYKGYVSVSIQLTNNYVSLKVVDNGMGVSKDNLHRLFDRFYRVDSTGSRKFGGNGLGLAIAKELTELQGGTISVSSVIGKGTEFVVTIPKAETTYRETFEAVLAGSPRHEILYENAQAYLLSAAAEIDISVSEINEMSDTQMHEVLSYMLSTSEDERNEYSVTPPSDMLPARYEKNRRSRVRDTTAHVGGVDVRMDVQEGGRRELFETAALSAERNASRSSSPRADTHKQTASMTDPSRTTPKVASVSSQPAKIKDNSKDLPLAAENMALYQSKSAVRRAAMESTGEIKRNVESFSDENKPFPKSAVSAVTSPIKPEKSAKQVILPDKEIPEQKYEKHKVTNP